MYAPYVDRRDRSFRFRSSYEIAFVEQYLDARNTTWEYEQRCFDLENTTYTPDFWVEELNSFVEIKGWVNKTFPSKLAKFREMYPDEKLIVAYPSVIVETFGVDISKESISSIHSRFKIKTFARKQNLVVHGG